MMMISNSDGFITNYAVQSWCSSLMAGSDENHAGSLIAVEVPVNDA